MKRLDTRDQSLTDKKESPSSSSTESSAPAKGDDGALAKAIDGLYEAYPKKSGIGPVREAARSLGLTLRDVAGASAALERLKASPGWAKAGGRFVPLPENWLKARPWTEEDCRAAERREAERAENEGYEAERKAISAGQITQASLRIPDPKQIPDSKP
jgi:hypothetical protein